MDNFAINIFLTLLLTSFIIGVRKYLRLKYSYESLFKIFIRNRVIKEKKDIIVKTNNEYTLRNRYLILKYDIPTGIIACHDILNNENQITVSLKKEDNLFNQRTYFEDKIFDEILVEFSHYTKFKDVYSILKCHPRIISDTIVESDFLPKTKELKKVLPELKKIEKINVNDADEKTISHLAGINIIQAKKLIRYRDLNHGFKTKEEFIKVAKLKEHFIEKVSAQIEIGDYFTQKTNDINDERKLDF